jgi:hypothetical protein
MLLKILKVLHVTQIRHTEYTKKYGLAPRRSLNPYNPLSYVVLIMYCIILFVLCGIEGVGEHIGKPFKFE